MYILSTRASISDHPQILFSYGLMKQSDMVDKMKQEVMDMCVSNLEKFRDNQEVEL